jgi:hypothetical protein
MFEQEIQSEGLSYGVSNLLKEIFVNGLFRLKKIKMKICKAKNKLLDRSRAMSNFYLSQIMKTLIQIESNMKISKFNILPEFR